MGIPFFLCFDFGSISAIFDETIHSLRFDMKTIRFFFVLVLAVGTGCTTSSNQKDNHAANMQQEEKNADQAVIALEFINSYVVNCNMLSKGLPISEWTEKQKRSTTDFNAALQKIVATADPEMGLDADPIFDAQDYPEKGFEVEKVDQQNNAILMKGIDWPEFKLILLVSKVNGTWLVNGCGAVNVPVSRRAARNF